MEEAKKNKNKNKNKSEEAKKMTRKQALVKTGYIAFSAASMMMLFSNPAKAQAGTSPANIPNW